MEFACALENGIMGRKKSTKNNKFFKDQKPSQQKQKKIKTLDLHGKKTEEVFDLVDRFIYSAIQDDLSEVCIMTGKGSGKIQAEVKKYLQLGNYPWSFEKKGNDLVNTGVMVVEL